MLRIFRSSNNNASYECHKSLLMISHKSTLVQVMTWFQGTSDYLCQCWPRSCWTYGITEPHWATFIHLVTHAGVGERVIIFLYNGLSNMESTLGTSVASFTKEVNQRLAKRPLKTNGRLANRRLTSLVKEATGGWQHKQCSAEPI